MKQYHCLTAAFLIAIPSIQGIQFHKNYIEFAQAQASESPLNQLTKQQLRVLGKETAIKIHRKHSEQAGRIQELIGLPQDSSVRPNLPANLPVRRVYIPVHSQWQNNKQLKLIIDDALAVAQARRIVSHLASELASFHCTEPELTAFVEAIVKTLKVSPQSIQTKAPSEIETPALFSVFYQSLQGSLSKLINTPFTIQLPSSTTQVLVTKLSVLSQSQTDAISHHMERYGVLDKAQLSNRKQLVPYGFMTTKDVPKPGIKKAPLHVHVFLFEPIEVAN